MESEISDRLFGKPYMAHGSIIWRIDGRYNLPPAVSSDVHVSNDHCGDAEMHGRWCKLTMHQLFNVHVPEKELSHTASLRFGQLCHGACSASSG